MGITPWSARTATHNNQKEYRIMLAKRILILTLALSLALTSATGCGAVAYARLPRSAAAPLAPTAAPVDNVTPKEVVSSFYDWYLSYCSGPDRGNPLVDGAYRERAELAPELVAEMDTLLASPNGRGADPFLMAQDVPTGYEITNVTTTDDTANVVLSTSFEGHQLAVTLLENGEAWQIRHITRPGVEPGPISPVTSDHLAEAATQVQAFYDWYLAYVTSGQDGPRSILSDGSFETCAYLTHEYIEQLKGLVASGGLQADPFLCAQDIPTTVTVQQAVASGADVQVTMASSFEGHTFNVLARETALGVWQIDAIQPASN